MSPAQKFRDLIEDTRYGLAGATELHNGLSDLEMELGLALSLSEDERTP